MKIVLEIDDTPEVRKSLQYLSDCALEEARFWRNNCLNDPKRAEAYELLSAVFDLEVSASGT